MPRGVILFPPFHSMLRRLISCFRRKPAFHDGVQPSLEMLFDRLVDTNAEQVIGEDRFRIRLFPALHDGKRQPAGSSNYWLDLQFKADRKWISMLCLHEAKLDILRDVLYEADRYIDEQNNRPHRLPTIRLGNRRFFIDQRLSQLRNVDDPSDFVNI